MMELLPWAVSFGSGVLLAGLFAWGRWRVAMRAAEVRGFDQGYEAGAHVASRRMWRELREAQRVARRAKGERKAESQFSLN